MEAIMVIIHKPERDSDRCSSYPAISLLNVDVKIVAQVLAGRLNAVITTLVHKDSSGFIPGKVTDINLCQLFTHLLVHHDNVGT